MITQDSHFDDIVNEIRYASDIVEVISERVDLKRTGKNYKGLCPFHSEKTPSFSVDPEKQFYHCFGCGASGDVFSFIMKMEKIGFMEAVKLLADRAGISLPSAKRSPQQEKKAKERKELYDINKEASTYYHDLLLNSKAAENARKYLKKRGFSQEIIERFELGYSLPSWDGLLKAMGSKGIRPQLLVKAGLALPRKAGKGFYDRFRGRIMFPILNLRNQVIGFGGRILEEVEDQPKYINSPETLIYKKGNNLYGLHLAKSSIQKLNKAIIVEGYVDVITAHQCGIDNVVASLGTSLTRGQVKLLARYAEEVNLAFDADTAGSSATKRGMDLLKQEKLDIKIALIPRGMDPDSFIRAKSKDAFLEAVDNSQSILDFMINITCEKYDKNKAEGKVNIINALLPAISSLKDPISQGIYIKRLSEELEVGEIIIRSQLAQLKKTRKRAPTFSLEDLVKLRGEISAEKGLIQLILFNQELVAEVVKEIKIIDLTNPSYCSIMAVIKESFENNISLDPDYLLNHLEDERARETLTELLLEGRDHIILGQERALLDDYLTKIKEHNIKIKREEIQQKISEAEAKGDFEGAKRFLQKFEMLQREGRN